MGTVACCNLIDSHQKMANIPSDADLLKILDESYEEAWEIFHDEEGWKEEKKIGKVGNVCSKKNKQDKKMFRAKAIIDCPAEKLIKAFDACEDITKWNPDIGKFEIIREFDNSNVRITFQQTKAAGPGGMVAARDFIILFKAEKGGDEWMQGGSSIEYPYPSDPRVVRGWNHPGGTMVKPASDPNKCELTWLMNCEFRGSMPDAIAEIAMPIAQTQFVGHVEKLAKTLK